jgi:hypothetical protein
MTWRIARACGLPRLTWEILFDRLIEFLAIRPGNLSQRRNTRSHALNAYPFIDLDLTAVCDGVQLGCIHERGVSVKKVKSRDENRARQSSGAISRKSAAPSCPPAKPSLSERQNSECDDGDRKVAKQSPKSPVRKSSMKQVRLKIPEKQEEHPGEACKRDQSSGVLRFEVASATHAY